MSEFPDLASLYTHLEKSAQDYHYPRDISNLFWSFEKERETATDGLKEAEASKARWEADFFSIHFEAGDCKHADFDIWPEEKRGYLKSRFEEAQNPVLKARYAHLLWCCDKHEEFAIKAVDSYLEIIPVYERQLTEGLMMEAELKLTRALINSHALAYQTTYRVDEVKDQIRRIALDFPLDHQASILVRRDLINHILNDKRKFNKTDAAGLGNICRRMAELLMANKREDLAEEFLDLGPKIELRIGRKRDQYWARKKAECNEALMVRYKNTPNEYFHWQTTLENYREVGDAKKVKELEAKYRDVTARTPSSRITIEHDPGDLPAEHDALADEIAAQRPKQICEFLSSDRRLLPRLETLHNLVDARSNQGIVDRMQVGIIDQRGHMVGHFQEDNSKRRANAIKFYEISLECFELELLKRILAKSIKQGKLTTESFLEFLRTHTWFDLEIKRRLPGRSPKKYKWLDLIVPAVTQSISNISAYNNNPSVTPDCVLAVDSLTLKLEGLIRELCESHGITVWKSERKGSNEPVYSEKYLGALLRDPATENLFDPNEFFFFKFLLVEQGGYNLRNRVAHALFMGIEDYRIEYCMWGLVALLRLGKYDLGDQLR